MTKQEIFDKVATHLLTQNAKSLREGTTSCCAYRGDNGTKCAIGCLIPDEAYTTEIEGNTVRAWKAVKLLKALYGSRIKDHMSFLGHLQVCHDRFSVGDWKDQLKHLAEVHLLDATVVDKF